MDRKPLSRRLSSSSIGGVPVDNRRKKHSITFLNVFHTRKSEESGKSSTSIFDYFKYRKTRTKQTTSGHLRVPTVWEDDNESTKKFSCNTWSLTTAKSAPSLSEEDYDLADSDLVRQFSDNGNNKRRSGPLKHATSVPHSPNPDGIPVSFVELFAPQVPPTANCALDVPSTTTSCRNSVVSENESLYCEDASIDTYSVSPHSSITSLPSPSPHHLISLAPRDRTSPHHDSSTAHSKVKVKHGFNEGGEDYFRTHNPLLGDEIRGKRRALFDTWNGRNAMTLPRHSRKDMFNEGDDVGDKNKRPSIIERPKSMMVNRPVQYPAGNPPNSFTTLPGATRSKPVSNLDSGNALDPSSNRSSYYEEEDGISSILYPSAKNQTSGSCESLNETRSHMTDFENDPDLRIKSDEPDSWSATTDKKFLKKHSLSKKDIKRQENIFEFIQTERNHLTTLKILQLIYARGLVNELKMDKPTIDKLFPQIDDHVEVVSQFVKQLTARQAANKVVSGIGDVIVNQWEGRNGEMMKRLFGDFCSKQNEITVFYKDLIKTDKKFQVFMKKCDSHRLTRRQDVPGCALLITQRLTKYPIMLQTMLENSNKKDHKDDYHNLERALELSREIAKDVDEQVQMHEREILLMETYDKIDSKSSTTFKDGNRKFDRKDFLRRNRKLLYSTCLRWKESRKFIDVFFLLLSDCIVLLQENNGRYTFPSGQHAAIPLQKMIVREVANDEKQLYLMSMRSQQMYTLMLSSVDDCKTLTNTIRLAIGKCPDEDESIPSEDDSERRSHDHRLDKARQMLNQLVLTDQRINRMLEEKMTFFKALADNVGRGNVVANLHFSFPDHFPSVDDASEGTFPPGSPILLNAIAQVNKLTLALYGPGGLTRHPSSVGEHASSSRSPPSLPKRSDTFGGFDNGKEPSSPRAKYLNTSQSDGRLSDVSTHKAQLPSTNRDSGFHSQLTMVHASNSHSSIAKTWDPPVEVEREVEEDDAYLPPTSDQVVALTTLTKLLSEYETFAAQQDTYVERLQMQLVVGRKKTHGGGLQEAELKRNQIKQQEQMDDLRKQQQKFLVEKEQWQKQVERFQRSLDSDRVDVKKEREQLLQEKEENERERSEIAKAKEEYQRELTRLRSLQRQAQLPHELHPSSSTSSLPSINKNNNNSESSLSKSQSTLASVGDTRLTKPNPSPTFSSGEYPRTFPGPKRDSSNTQQQQLPIHLQLSAANQTTNPQAVKPQDFSRLSKLATVSKSSGGSKQTAGGIHNLLPQKLRANTTSSASSKKHHIV